MQYINLYKAAEENTDFRRVLYTGKHSQIAVMSLDPQEEIEWGIGKTDKTILVLSGTGMAVVEDDEREMKEGDLFMIPAGKKHDFANTGEDVMKLMMIYAPPVYPDGASHGSRLKAIVDPFSPHSGELPKTL